MEAMLPPGPGWPSPIQTLAWITRPIPFVERMRERYGKRFSMKLLGAPRWVVFSDPAELKQIFTAPPEVLYPGEGALILEPLVGRYSLILLDGADHLSQRRLMLPAFHGEKMEALSDLVAETAEREIAGWPRGRRIELHPRLQALTLDVILRAVFGLESGERLEALRSTLSQLLAFSTNPMSLIPQAWLLEAVPGPAREFRKVADEADRLIFELVADRRQDSRGDDVLALLLGARHEDGSPMSDQELRDELMTMLVAGHETTASALGWTLSRLVADPAVLSRLVSEIDRGEDDSYLTATIQEALRRRPVLINAAPRAVKQPIEVGGRWYPPGIALVPGTYLVHHDPEIYPDPYAFRPERFLDSEPGTYTWTPFGGGRRRCIGASFAMMEMKLVLAALLRHVDLRGGADGLEPTLRRGITISPGRGTPVVLEEREPTPVAA